MPRQYQALLETAVPQHAVGRPHRRQAGDARDARGDELDGVVDRHREKLFVVVGGEGVVVLAGLLCVACYQTRTSARTRVDSAHLSRRRAIPSFAPPRAAARGRPPCM